MKYGGFFTISQSGEDKSIIKAVKLAYKNNLTCFNIVNVENSRITKLVDELQRLDLQKKVSESPVVLLDISDDSDDEPLVDKNIGMYQKSGHCWSDVKSFIP